MILFLRRFVNSPGGKNTEKTIPCRIRRDEIFLRKGIAFLPDVCYNHFRSVREWRNWQTRMIQVHVCSTHLQVQVLFPAHRSPLQIKGLCFFFSVLFSPYPRWPGRLAPGSIRWRMIRTAGCARRRPGEYIQALNGRRGNAASAGWGQDDACLSRTDD